MARIADFLTEADHDVTFLAPIADETKKGKLGVKLTKDVVIVERDDHTKNLEEPSELVNLWTIGNGENDIKEAYSWLNELLTTSCANFVRNNKVFVEMKERSFDVAIIDPMSICGLGYAKALGIEKTILVSVCPLYDFMVDHFGEPLDHSYVPSMSAVSGDKMTIWERYQNYKLSRAESIPMEDLFDKETALYRKYLGEDLPDWKELLPAASLLFTNSNPYLDFPRLSLQKTVPIAGITIETKKTDSGLDEKWNEILSKRPKTFLISFGSIVYSHEMPLEFKMNIANVIKSEPNVTFIWKYETDETSFANDLSNVVFSKWIPQVSLLTDPRLTAFLTHGGIGSSHELAHSGKPGVTVPLFADQFRNAKMMEKQKSTIFLRKDDLANFEVLKNAVHEILYNEKYAKNARHLADLLADQPFQPKDLLVKHTEFVGKYGPFPQMDSAGRHLNWWSRNLIDVFLIQLAGRISVVLFVIWSGKYVISKVFRVELKTKKIDK